MSRRLRNNKVANLKIVAAGAGTKAAIDAKDFVSVPLLPVQAASPGNDVDPVDDIDQLKPETLWAAPATWCPNPASTISLRVKGDSMSPLILDGYIIAVDTSDRARDGLVDQIVVAQNRTTKKLLVSRLIRFEGKEALISDQRGNVWVSLATETKWRIIGRVLWWTGKSR